MIIPRSTVPSSNRRSVYQSVDGPVAAVHLLVKSLLSAANLSSPAFEYELTLIFGSCHQLTCRETWLFMGEP
ncbi:hypothetical protein MUK42_14221 [Musa troglodytarum]|uniref:Uncharacterized protein n=1 Tax=Musa troglodytarum TaxID=320322 RepID=A0A9E7JM39_9LILI|nr:hypothetical protein MUK42_14221 [Musa troglodytarum]